MKVKNYFDTDDRPGRRPPARTGKKADVKKSDDKGIPAKEAEIGTIRTESIKISVAAHPYVEKASLKKCVQKPVDQPKDTQAEKQAAAKAPAACVRVNAASPAGDTPRSKTISQSATQSNVVSMEDRLSRKRTENIKPAAAEDSQSVLPAVEEPQNAITAVAVEPQSTVSAEADERQRTETAAEMPAEAEAADGQAVEAVTDVDSVSISKSIRSAAGLSAATSSTAAETAVETAPPMSAEAAITVWQSPAGLSAAAFMPGGAAPEVKQTNMQEAGDDGSKQSVDPDSEDDGGEDGWDKAVKSKAKRNKADKEKGKSGGGTGGDNGGRRKLPVVWVVVIDVVIAALLLLAFSLYYIIIPRDMSGDEKELPRPTQTAVATPAPTESLAAEPVVTEEPEPTPTPDGTAWGANFPGVFTDGEVVQDETSYKSGNISVSIEHKELNEVSYYVADIYIKDYQYFRTAFGNENTFGYIDRTGDILEYAGGIIGVNGDYCKENKGVVVRNGLMQRDKMHDSDLLVLNYDGTMQTYSPEEFDVEKIKAEGVWQVWTFGPMLLQDGQPMTEFNTTSRIAAGNPRTAVGYYEPGHYCFVVSDGRSPQPTDGFTMAELSQLLSDMGCKVAYNMDGGKSSEMVFLGETLNEPYEGGRRTSDILYIADDKGGY